MLPNQYKFGAHREGKSRDNGFPYNFIELSDGFEKGTIQVPEGFVVPKIDKGTLVEIQVGTFISREKLQPVLEKITVVPKSK